MLSNEKPNSGYILMRFGGPVSKFRVIAVGE
jgi:hypothetical protein